MLSMYYISYYYNKGYRKDTVKKIRGKKFTVLYLVKKKNPHVSGSEPVQTYVVQGSTVYCHNSTTIIDKFVAEKRAEGSLQ